MLRIRKSQSILEYVIILTAVVAGIIFAANRFIRPATEDMISSAGITMERQGAMFIDKVGGGIPVDFESGKPLFDSALPEL